VRFQITNSTATEINTQALLAAALNGNPLGCSGYYIYKPEEIIKPVTKIYRDNATRVGITVIEFEYYTTSNIVISGATVSDTVTTVY